MEGEPLIPHVSVVTLGESKWNSIEYRKKCFNVLLVFLPLIILPFVMVMPNAIEMHYDVVCSYLNIDSDKCSSSNDVSQYIARMTNVTALLTTMPAILMIPIVTAFVEKIGLEWGLMFVLSGFGTQLLLMYPVAYWLPSHWSPYRLLIYAWPSVFTAATALSNFCLLAINQLFPEAELRPLYVGRFMGATAFVSFLGPALGSLLSQNMSMGGLFLTASVMYLFLTACFVYMVELPPLISGVVLDAEVDRQSVSNVSLASLVEENRKVWFWENLITQMGALKVFSFSSLPSMSLKVTGILITLWIVFFTNMDLGDLQVFMLYGKQFFNWHQGSLGILMTLNPLAELMSSVVIFPLLQKLLLKLYQVRADAVDSVDKFFMILAIACNALGFVVMGTATNGTAFFVGFFIFGLASLAGVVAKPALLKLVPSDEVASLITALSVIERISSTVVPVSLLYIYEETLSSWPSFLFKAQAILTLGFLVLTILFLGTKYPSP